jgi:hypothetical protein
MYYSVNRGVVEKKLISIKKLAFRFGATAAIIGAMAAPASAASNNYCGSSANGCDSANAAGAQCGSGAASGAFGAFGKDNNLAGGANGQETGRSNSAVCGNRQGNLSE